jgi:hypothetical protein
LYEQELLAGIKVIPQRIADVGRRESRAESRKPEKRF